MGRTRTDLIGRTFGKLTVINLSKKDKWGISRWECQCDCGGVKNASTSDLNGRKIQSCGCGRYKTGAEHKNWKGGKIEYKCSNPACSKIIVKYKSVAGSYEKHYCSNECRTAVIGWNNHPRKRVNVPCVQCGKVDEIHVSRNKMYENHFCGADCYAKWRSEHLTQDANPNWLGGVSYEPYPVIWASKKFKLGIRERDNHKCQNPDCRKNDDVLTIHHINYDKKDCEPTNLITLCRSCNARANFNRDFWQAGYSEIIRLKYQEDQQLIAI